MSIETATSSDTVTMGSEKHKSKSEKKHKSSHGEKKRKRDHEEEGHKSKSKKHKTDKQQTTEATSVETPDAVSPFHMQTSSLFLPLAPVSQQYPLEGMCAEHLSPLILQYYPPFNGVVLSYSNPRLSEKPFGDSGDSILLQNIDEYAVSWAWVTADFLLFKPENKAWLEGYINLQTDGHIGLVCWNLFSASIERKRLPSDWEWRDGLATEDAEDAEAGETYAEDGNGYYVDGEGNKVDGMIKFRVKEIESSHDRERGFLAIAGTMLSRDAEDELVENERNSSTASRESAGKRLGGSRALGATVLGIPAESDEKSYTGGGKGTSRGVH